ncbi:MAG TPA: hypothetical protein PKB10_12795, partial [Tepidisphaeraceae bacterium]|nr:hypothetical protein [Tepidisphaeraceae bacterium]
MASHGHSHAHELDVLRLSGLATRLPFILAIVGIIGIAGALGLGLVFGDDTGGIRRFYFSYLIAYAYFLSIAIGALFFVMIQHLVSAGWSVNVRRIAEGIAAGAFPVLALLSIPILISVLSGNGSLYRWAWHSVDAHPHSEIPPSETAPAAGAYTPPHVGTDADAYTRQLVVPVPDTVHEHPSAHGVKNPAEIGDTLTLKKRAWLNPTFFSARLVFYLVALGLLSRFFWRHSVQQDNDGDVQHSVKMKTFSAPGLLIFGLLTTFLAFDLIMSLDPQWYSTMYGVYYFSGGLVSFFAVLVIAIYLLQRAGYLKHSITTEHRHDIGKFLFGFTFFFGYIAFSQYMLLWYSSLPETVMWMTYRGATTNAADFARYFPYTVCAILIALGCFALPFAGLLSRHVKRNRGALLFWAIWLLAFHFVDKFWQIMPELNGGFHLGLPELAAMIGVGGIVSANVIRVLAQ